MRLTSATRVLRAELRKFGPAVASVMVFTAVYNILLLTNPLFILLVYDRVIASRSVQTLVALMLIVVVLLVIMGVLDYARRRLLARVGAAVQERLEGWFVDRERAKSFGRLAPGATGTLFRHIGTLGGLFRSNALVSVLDVVWTPLFVGVIFLLHPILGWATVTGLLVMMVIIQVERFVARKQFDVSAQQRAVVASRTDVIRSFAVTIREQHMIDAVSDRWLEARHDSRQAGTAVGDASGLFRCLGTHLRLIMQVIVLAIGAYLVLVNVLSVGAMLAANFLFFRASRPVESFVSSLPLFMRAKAAWSALEVESDVGGSVTRGQRLCPGNSLCVSLRRVSACSRINGTPVLDNVSVDVRSGEIVSIVGPANCGKSTLASILIGSRRPDAGDALLDGVPLERYAVGSLERCFGYLPQEPRLLHGTVAQNIAGMRSSPEREAVDAAAALAGIDRWVDSLPEGYATSIDGHAGEMSCDQRTRIALARALYGWPRCLVLDCPDRALLQTFGDSLTERLRDYVANGNIVILLSREPVRAISADRTLVLTRGLLKEYGRPRRNVAGSRPAMAVSA